MIYLKLFWDFFRVSCFTFGGAYGAIPLIRDMVLANGWLSDERITYMIAVSESTPTVASTLPRKPPWSLPI